MYHCDRNNGIVYLLCIACALTMLSQIPYFVNSGITQRLSMPIWIVLLLVSLKNKPKIIIKNIGFFLLLILLSVYLGINMVFQRSFLSSSIDKQIYLSAFIMLVGITIGDQITQDDIEKTCTIFILSTLVTCLFVFLTYVRGVDLSSRVYVYASKNSISQILLFAWILIVTLKIKSYTPIIKIVFYVLSLLLLTWTMIGLKSRASLLGIPLCIAWMVYNGRSDKRLRNMLILICAILFIYFVFNQNMLFAFVDNVIFGGRDVQNLNDLSSGRADEWKYFFRDFSQNGFLGDPLDKRESVFLSSFLQHGIIGGIIISSLAFYPLFFFRSNIKRGNRFYITLTSMAIVAVFNSFFEQQAPFGPGAKCFFLWLMIGLFSSCRTEDAYSN